MEWFILLGHHRHVHKLLCTVWEQKTNLSVDFMQSHMTSFYVNIIKYTIALSQHTALGFPAWFETKATGTAHKAKSPYVSALCVCTTGIPLVQNNVCGAINHCTIWNSTISTTLPMVLEKLFLSWIHDSKFCFVLFHLFNHLFIYFLSIWSISWAICRTLKCFKTLTPVKDKNCVLCKNSSVDCLEHQL